ncbi:hypothetical protein PS880_02024 [Pseudomonas fluorescens]|uniref:Uncharacterized protein n=1 Tax=Pseudomonas fluorescens TaxID=294 RepID=A0A5E7JDU1_PSEFL|nr:hypothetical protein PS880_02024 [Pseudomonas fluorescens]
MGASLLAMNDDAVFLTPHCVYREQARPHSLIAQWRWAPFLQNLSSRPTDKSKRPYSLTEAECNLSGKSPKHSAASQ